MAVTYATFGVPCPRGSGWCGRAIMPGWKTAPHCEGPYDYAKKHAMPKQDRSRLDDEPSHAPPDDMPAAAHHIGSTGHSPRASGGQTAVCIVCGSTVSQQLFRRVPPPRDSRGWADRYRITHSHRDLIGAILQCHTCRTGYLPPHFVFLSTSRYSHAEDPHYLEEAHARKRNADALLSFLPPGTQRALLEIGSACGFLLDAARQRGFEVEGIEPSAWAVEQTRRRFGLLVRCFRGGRAWDGAAPHRRMERA